MSLLEILLTAANLVAFITQVVPLPSTMQWARTSVWIALLLAGLQLLLEGPRRVLAPAYGIAALLVLVWLLQNFVGWKLESRLLSALVIVISVLGLVAATVLPVALPAYHFPEPSGPYAVGTLTYHWIDAARPEIFTPDPQDQRELMVQIWYPASARPTSPRAPYIADASALASGLSRLQRVPELLFANLNDISGNAFTAAPVAGDEPAYPVLIFTEGATGFRQMNTFQVEELVSHGYIVAAIDQPYAASTVVFPDGRRAEMPPIEQWRPLVRASYIPPSQPPLLNGQALPGGSVMPYFAQDVVFTLNQLDALNRSDPNGILTGRLDLQRTGIFGVSLGGITGAEACLTDARLRACLFLDAPMPVSVVQAGLQQPAMWITRDAQYMRLERERTGGWSEEEITAHQTSMRAAYERLPAEGYFVQIPGIFHIDFTDVPAWNPIFHWVGAAGPIGIDQAHEILNAYTLAFFDRQFKGQPTTRFDELVEAYPDVLLESHAATSTRENNRPSSGAVK